MFFNLDGERLLVSEFVQGAAFQLLAADKDKYEYPADGWYWFDTEEEAREFFGLPPKEEMTLPPGFIPPPGWLPLNVI